MFCEVICTKKKYFAEVSKQSPKKYSPNQELHNKNSAEVNEFHG